MTTSISPTMAQVLDLVDTHFEPAARIVAHAEALGIKRATAGRALRKLLAAELVERDDEARYRLPPPEVPAAPEVPRSADLTRAVCARCGLESTGADVEWEFGFRRDKRTVRVQGYCRGCRSALRKATRDAQREAKGRPGGGTGRS